MQHSYRGSKNSYADDLAVLYIEGTIVISDSVMPVCIDRSRTYNLYNEPKAFGTVS